MIYKIDRVGWRKNIKIDREIEERQSFYQKVRNAIQKKEDKQKLDQIKTSKERMLCEIQTKDNTHPQLGKNKKAIVNLDLICKGDGLLDIRYMSLDPNNIKVLVSSVLKSDDPRTRRLFSVKFPRETFLDYMNHKNKSDASDQTVMYSYKGQEFPVTSSFIPYMNEKGEVFCYYDPEYFYRMHRDDIPYSTLRLIHRLKLNPLPPSEKDY